MKYFYAISEEGSISSAAKRLNVAQPALSRQMKELEAELGVQLFERGSRKIRLTEAGRLLRRRAEVILGLVDGAIEEMNELHSGVGGSIAIGTVTTSGAMLLPQAIAQFHHLYPNVTLQIWEGDSVHVLELLEKGIIEIGIIRTPFDSDWYDSLVLPHEELVIALNRAAFPGKGESEVMAAAELAAAPLIVPRRWKAMFEDWCRMAGVQPNIVCVCDGIILNILWAKMGIGMALVPKSTEGIIGDGVLTYRRLAEPAVSTKTMVVWLRNRHLSASAKHFLQVVQDVVVHYQTRTDDK